LKKEPVFRKFGSGPVWWHTRGLKMHLKECDENRKHIVIEGSAAKVTIDRVNIDRIVGWFVEWRVVNCFPIKEQTDGRVMMSYSELAAAFGLNNDYVVQGSDWLIDQYGGTVASQGKFIRYQKYLNIPCPGTGHDGDPNVSIELKEEIKEAVGSVLNYTKVLV